MSGPMFHENRHDLHGITVVVETTGDRTIVGRFHDVAGGMVRLHDAAVHESPGGAGRDEFLRRVAKFGVPPEHRMLPVAEAEIRRITPLGQLTF